MVINTYVFVEYVTHLLLIMINMYVFAEYVTPIYIQMMINTYIFIEYVSHIHTNDDKWEKIEYSKRN